MAGWVGRRLGDLGGLLFRRRSRLALANLGQAFPHLSETERRRLCRRSWQHLGLTVIEWAQFLRWSPERLAARITIEGRDHLERVMRAHGRALVLSAHLGNWEVLPAASRLTGYPLAVVVRPLDSPGLDRLAGQVRRRAGVEVIDKRQALGPVLHALRRGGMVGILLDQNAIRPEGAFVPFFGRPASTSRALAVLALRTGTPIVPVFAYRRPRGRHHVVVRPPIDPPPGNDRAAAVVELTARCTAEVEAAIRACPEQWLWIHDRWRTRPVVE